jgi:hypothetical protein
MLRLIKVGEEAIWSHCFDRVGYDLLLRIREEKDLKPRGIGLSLGLCATKFDGRVIRQSN